MRSAPGIRFNEHLDEEDGPLVFHHACKLGLEGIVSKRRDSVYSSGRSPHWHELAKFAFQLEKLPAGMEPGLYETATYRAQRQFSQWLPRLRG